MYKTFYFKFIFIHMKSICDLQITPISNTHMFMCFVFCIIAHLLQGSVMEQSLYKHRQRLPMTQSVIDKCYYYHGFGLKAFEGRHIRMKFI